MKININDLIGPTVKVEYKIEIFETDYHGLHQEEEYLNLKGKERWELIQIKPFRDSARSANVYYFIRLAYDN